MWRSSLVVATQALAQVTDCAGRHATTDGSALMHRNAPICAKLRASALQTIFHCSNTSVSCLYLRPSRLVASCRDPIWHRLYMIAFSLNQLSLDPTSALVYRGTPALSQKLTPEAPCTLRLYSFSLPARGLCCLLYLVYPGGWVSQSKPVIVSAWALSRCSAHSPYLVSSRD